jgi:hypothetical protein
MLVMAPNLLRGGRHHGFLENVVTHPELRGQGHGKRRAWFPARISSRLRCSATGDAQRMTAPGKDNPQPW